MNCVLVAVGTVVSGMAVLEIAWPRKFRASPCRTDQRFAARDNRQDTGLVLNHRVDVENDLCKDNPAQLGRA